VKYWNAETSTAILRVARDHFRLLWAALTLVVMVAGEYASVRVVHVGGSMRSCYKSGVQIGLAEMQVGMAMASGES
jgi:ribonuclease P/MRP protein subunit POP5